MDITKSSDKVKSFKYLNGETVNYAVCYFAVSLLFLIFKQLFKIALGLSAGISAGIAAAVSAVVLFFLERRYVFNRTTRSKTAKQALTYLFRCAVDFGFYKIASFVFVTILKNHIYFAFFICFFIYLFFNYYFDRLIVFDCIKSAAGNKNGRVYQTFWANRYVLLSALIFTLFLGLVYLIFSVFPFGDVTVLRMDLYHQYGPLFCELYDRLTGIKSFSYSWISGGGSSFLGNYFNYLSSPLSLLILLFDRKQMPLAITTIVTVKGMLSTAAFTLYLKHSLKHHSLMTASFGVFYGFSAYFLAYYWNVMWLDGMFLFPIIVLGVERIINEYRPLCYLISLTVLFFSSYYMAYMVCLFSVVYFVMYFFLKCELSDKVRKDAVFEKRYAFGKIWNLKLIRSGVIFAGASVLAALLCAFALIPVYMVLQNSSATSDSFPTSFEFYHDILNIITSHLAALETTIRSSGDDVLPNIYCGILGLILAPLYITNKKIRIREKAVYIILLLFFFISFNTNFANFIWHAFHFPNDLPFRFSFMYSFIFLVVAFRTLMNFKAIEYRDIAMSGIFWTFLVILLQKYMTNKMETLTIYANIGLILAWTAFLLLVYNKKLGKMFINATLVFILFCESVFSVAKSIPFSQEYSVYTKNYDTYTEAIDHTYNEDDSFYRLELSELVTRMDACLYGYRGMSTFSSMAYESYSGNQYSLGMYGNRINSYTYYTQTPVYNMFYSVKYLIKTENSLKPSVDFYRQRYTTKDDTCEVYENKYFLPVAFTASNDIKDAVIEEGNPFEVQEDLIDTACGVSDVFLPVKYVNTDYTDVDSEDVSENGTYYFSKSDPDGTTGSIDITVKTVNDSNLYVYITSPKLENVNYYWGDEETVYQNIDTPYIMDLGKHKKGDEVKISLDCGSMDADSSYFEIYAYNIDYDKFVSAYELLNAGAMNITSYSDTALKGTVNAGYNGILYTSIPYDEGWSIFIDGKKQPLIELHDAQLACEITKGEHTVVLKFTPKGALWGIAASAAAWGGVGCWCAYRFIKKKKAQKEFVEIV